jgi:hypothetical protein
VCWDLAARLSDRSLVIDAAGHAALLLPLRRTSIGATPRRRNGVAAPMLLPFCQQRGRRQVRRQAC